MSTTIALLHKHFDADKLSSVQAEMEVLGAPTIRAVWHEGWAMWVALEGCHRLRAAHALGLMPEIEEVEYSDDEITMDAGDTYAISEIVDEAYSAATLTFED